MINGEGGRGDGGDSDGGDGRNGDGGTGEGERERDWGIGEGVERVESAAASAAAYLAALAALSVLVGLYEFCFWMGGDSLTLDALFVSLGGWMG
jgi:hypothetical protein